MKRLIDRYPGIRSFEAQEAHLFFGRNREIHDFYQMVKVNRLSVLFSKSGLGKSSLLNAGVIPKLSDDVYKIFKIRFQNTAFSPAALIREGLRLYAEQTRLVQKAEQRLASLQALTGQPPGLWEQLRAYNFEEELGFEPIFVFDQFEEFFLHSQAAQKELIELLADIIYQRIPVRLYPQNKDPEPVQGLGLLGLLGEVEEKEKEADPLDWWRQPLNFKIIIAIRSDRLSLLDQLSSSIPTILQQRYQLMPLGQEQVEDAIKLPARLHKIPPQIAEEDSAYSSPSFEYSDAAVNTIYKALRSEDKGEVESFQLQIVCRHMEELVIKKNLSQIEEKHIGGQEGISLILNNYYENRISSLGSLEQQFKARHLIEEGLIVDGARVSLAEAIVLSRYQIGEELLEKLLDTRIIKPENTHLGKAYEVSHDTLVGPILNSYEKRRIEEQKAKEKAEQLRLAQEAEAQRKVLEEERRKRRRANIIAAAAGLMGIVAIIATIFAFRASSEANEARDQALYAKDQALEGLNEAIRADINRLSDDFESFSVAGKAGKAPAKAKLDAIKTKIQELQTTSKTTTEDIENALKDIEQRIDTFQ